MYNVLIVEDDPMVAMINEQYIRSNKQFNVIGKCREGKSALDFLMRNDVDLLILDVFMPYTNGFETLRQIRKKKIAVEVIMVTAANDRESLEEALHLGVIDYLVKPFTAERFRIALEKFIVQTGALQQIEILNQKNIDFIINNSKKRGEGVHPKGIQEKTLYVILEQLREHENIWMTGDFIAEKVGLTGVTVRRYMNYLAEIGMVKSEMNYETGGRPCVLYRISK